MFPAPPRPPGKYLFAAAAAADPVLPVLVVVVVVLEPSERFAREAGPAADGPLVMDLGSMWDMLPRPPRPEFM